MVPRFRKKSNLLSEAHIRERFAPMIKVQQTTKQTSVHKSRFGLLPCACTLAVVLSPALLLGENKFALFCSLSSPLFSLLHIFRICNHAYSRAPLFGASRGTRNHLPSLLNYKLSHSPLICLLLVVMGVSLSLGVSCDSASSPNTVVCREDANFLLWRVFCPL